MVEVSMVGRQGIKIVMMFDGKWLYTIVFINPIRLAILTARRNEADARRFAIKKMAPMISTDKLNR
jgi:hypothetical protein